MFTTCSFAGQKEDPCLWASTIAEGVMKARQNDAPMVKAIAISNDANAPEEVKEVMRLMVIEAYESPGFSLESNKQKAVARFQNEWYLRCVKAD
jgi:type II secretory pathway component PulL